MHLAIKIGVFLIGETCSTNQNFPDSLLFKQKIARWDIGVGDVLKTKNSMGYVYLIHDSLLFRASTNKEYNFSVCYCDIITIYPSSFPLLWGQKIVNIETQNKTFKLGASPKTKKLIDLTRSMIKDEGTPISKKRKKR